MLDSNNVIPGGFLDRLMADWQAKGWPVEDLHSFRMEDGGDDGDEGDDEGDDDDGDKAPKAKFTQSQVNRIAAREKADGKKTAKAELLKEFGVESLEEAQSILKAHKDAQDSKKDEATKSAEAAEKAKRDAEAERLEAKRDRLNAKIERALVKAGLEDDEIDIVAAMVKVEDLDADMDTVKEAVEDLKKKMPRLFPTSEGDSEDGNPPRPRVPGSDPKKPPRSANNNGTPGEKARQLLEQRHGRVLQSRQSS